jgi:hypothetical protein
MKNCATHSSQSHQSIELDINDSYVYFLQKRTRSAKGNQIYSHFQTISFQGSTHHDHLYTCQILNKVREARVTFLPTMFIIGLHNEGYTRSGDERKRHA